MDIYAKDGLVVEFIAFLGELTQEGAPPDITNVVCSTSQLRACDLSVNVKTTFLWQ